MLSCRCRRGRLKVAVAVAVGVNVAVAVRSGCSRGCRCGRGRCGRRWSRTRADAADECESAVVVRTVYESDRRPHSSCYIDREQIAVDVGAV